MKKSQYPHASLYFAKEDDQKLLELLKEEANKNNMKFDTYLKQLIKAGRDKGIYNLPESPIQSDQSGRINELEEQINKLKGDIVRLTQWKDIGFDWAKILSVLDTESYMTEMQILKETGVIRLSLFDDRDDSTFYDAEISELQANLCLRMEYYHDVEFKLHQGWRLCKL